MAAPLAQVAESFAWVGEVSPILFYATSVFDILGGLSVLLPSLLVFAALAAACLVFARRFAGWGERGWAIYSAVTGVLIVIGFFLSGQAFAQVPGLLQIGGLLQRLTIAVGWGWLTLLAIHLRSADVRRDT